MVWKRMVFGILSKLNGWLLPSFIHKDLTRLNNFEKVVVAYRLWVTKNYLR